MNIKQLIKILSKFDPNKEIRIGADMGIQRGKWIEEQQIAGISHSPTLVIIRGKEHEKRA